MEVRLSAKIGETEVGVGVLILDMSKLFQAMHSMSTTTPGPYNGPVSHLFSPPSVSQIPFSVEVLSQNSTETEECGEVVAASTLPILTPGMSSTMSSPNMSISESSMTTTISADSTFEF